MVIVWWNQLVSIVFVVHTGSRVRYRTIQTVRHSQVILHHRTLHKAIYMLQHMQIVIIHCMTGYEQGNKFGIFFVLRRRKIVTKVFPPAL